MHATDSTTTKSTDNDGSIKLINYLQIFYLNFINDNYFDIEMVVTSNDFPSENSSDSVLVSFELRRCGFRHIRIFSGMQGFGWRR